MTNSEDEELDEKINSEIPAKSSEHSYSLDSSEQGSTTATDKSLEPSVLSSMRETDNSLEYDSSDLMADSSEWKEDNYKSGTAESGEENYSLNDQNGARLMHIYTSSEERPESGSSERRSDRSLKFFDAESKTKTPEERALPPYLSNR